MGVHCNNPRRKNLHLRSTLNPTTAVPKGLSPVPGWPGKFATRDGRIFSVKEVGYCNHNDGYLRVSVRLSSNKTLRPGVHQLVALAFLGPPPSHLARPEVRHLNGNRSDNRAVNLAWGSRKDNGQDLSNHGRLKGSKNPNSRLRESEVRSIRQSKKAGSQLAKQFGVSAACIRAIREHRLWNHL